MRFWNLLSWIVAAGAVVLLVSILFVPLQLFARYGINLLMTLLVLGFVEVLHFIYVFIKETPKRKWGVQEEKLEQAQPTFLGLKWKTWKSLGEWGFMLLVLLILWESKQGTFGNKECSDLIRGDLEGSTHIQYFYSPFCPACWKGELIVQELIIKHPKIRFENFDVRYCKNAMQMAGVRGSPSYYLKSGNKTEIIYEVDAENVENALCKMGNCS